MSYSLISETRPVAHKEHKCVWCGEQIEAGERYERVTGSFDGELQDDAFHLECRTAAHLHFIGGEEEFDPHTYKRGSTESRY